MAVSELGTITGGPIISGPPQPPAVAGELIGTSRTFEDFHARRAGDALRYAAAIVGAREAEDACQEAGLRIWRSWAPSAPDRLDAWASRIVRTCALDRGRSQSRPRTTEP